MASTCKAWRNGGELYARIALGPLLEGFDGGIVEARARATEVGQTRAAAARARTEAVAEAGRLAARRLKPTVFVEVGGTLRRLAHWEATRTRQTAGLAVKQFREVLPLLRGHADALIAAAGESEPELVDLLDVAESSAEDLLNANDADERQDLHMDLMCCCDDLADALQADSA